MLSAPDPKSRPKGLMLQIHRKLEKRVFTGESTWIPARGSDEEMRLKEGSRAVSTGTHLEVMCRFKGNE